MSYFTIQFLMLQNVLTIIKKLNHEPSLDYHTYEKVKEKN